jgi:hypothetical protein
MIFPPRWVQRARLPNYLAPSCVAWVLRPARHREDVWLLALRHAHSLRAPQMARRPRGVARQSAGGGGAGRTVEPPGALWAGAAAHRALAPPGLQGEAWRVLPCRRRRAPHDAPRFGWAVPVQEPHTPHAALPRFMPPHGALPVPRRRLGAGAQGREPAPGGAVDLPCILPPGPTALRGRPRRAPCAGGGAPPWGEGVPSAADACSTRLLLRLGAVDTGIGAAASAADAQAVAASRSRPGALPAQASWPPRPAPAARRPGAKRTGVCPPAPRAGRAPARVRPDSPRRCRRARARPWAGPAWGGRTRPAPRPVPRAGRGPSAAQAAASLARHTAPAPAGRWCGQRRRRSAAGDGS